MTAERRPATILSEFGEGYCRWCHFIEGLGADGTLYNHSRGIANSYGTNVPTVCDGSGKPPTKLTPLTSRKAAFSTRAKGALCPSCMTKVELVAGGWFVQHRPPLSFHQWCNWSLKKPPTRQR